MPDVEIVEQGNVRIAGYRDRVPIDELPQAFAKHLPAAWQALTDAGITGTEAPDSVGITEWRLNPQQQAQTKPGSTNLPDPADFGIAFSGDSEIMTAQSTCEGCGWEGPVMASNNYERDREHYEDAARILFDAHDCSPPPPPKVLAQIKLYERVDGGFDLEASCVWGEEGELKSTREEVERELLPATAANLLRWVLSYAEDHPID